MIMNSEQTGEKIPLISQSDGGNEDDINGNEDNDEQADDDGKSEKSSENSLE